MKKTVFKASLIGFILLLLLVGAGTGAIYLKAAPKVLVPVKLSGKFPDGQEYQVVVERVRLVRETGFLPLAWIKKRGHLPTDDHIADLSVSLAGKKVVIPADAYRDVKNPAVDQIWILQIGRIAILTIAGKDEGKAYKVRYSIWPPNAFCQREFAEDGKVDIRRFQPPLDPSHAQTMALPSGGGIKQIGEWKTIETGTSR